MMPLIGWLCTSHFARYIEDYDHWIAFALLAFLGIRMISDAFRPEDQKVFNPRKLYTQLMLAVATSIDALAIGISFALTGYSHVASLLQPLSWIGIVSFLFGIIGHLLGIRFGSSVSRRLKPELLGGIILLLIGIKILLSHLQS
jgi:putative Mn2+ efflux pump MntP